MPTKTPNATVSPTVSHAIARPARGNTKKKRTTRSGNVIPHASKKALASGHGPRTARGARVGNARPIPVVINPVARPSPNHDATKRREPQRSARSRPSHQRDKHANRSDTREGSKSGHAIARCSSPRRTAAPSRAARANTETPKCAAIAAPKEAAAVGTTTRPTPRPPNVNRGNDAMPRRECISAMLDP